ncbi:MAG: UPF0175 family protein [Anaerolineae bacterium]|nr:UPF0175 family protein [Anaerolineae bacterium]
MTLVQRVSRTELARNTRRILTAVQRGHTAVIESHGEPEAALIDIIDYRILRAFAHYYAGTPQIDVTQGLSEQVVIDCEDAEERYRLVLSHYLAAAISLGRAAELLGMPWLELRSRFQRLDIPLRTVPVDTEEVLTDVQMAAVW